VRAIDGAHTREDALAPRRVIDIELAGEQPRVARAVGERVYTHALAVVRLHGAPIGLVDLELPDPELEPAQLGCAISAAAGDAIARHLRDDGLISQDGITFADLPSRSEPDCQRARRRFLERAPAVSVVVATREQTTRLRTCLDSLLELDYPGFEIVVVDNAPVTDATRALVKGMADARVPVRYVREDHAGLASAHERGLAEVDAPLVAFTDDDVVVDRDWLTALALGFESAEGAACVTGAIVPTELETPAQVWLGCHAGFNKGFERIIFSRAFRDRDDPLFPYAAGRFGSGANMAFDVAALRSVGGFDLASGVGTPARGGDDLLAFFRVVNAGYALVYEPRALLWHDFRAEPGRLRRQMFDYGAGLTAYLTSVIFDDPRVVLDLMSRMPRVLPYALGSRPLRAARSRAPFEPGVLWAERLGMSYGPLGYVRSRRRERRRRAVEGHSGSRPAVDAQGATASKSETG
jgi:GT2 family glycosyltransferase